MSHDDGEKKGLQYSSTDDARTEVGNVVRHQYRKLSAAEQETMTRIKDLGAALISEAETRRTNRPEVAREASLAITKAEEAVMRAVKGLTKCPPRTFLPRGR